MELSSLALAFVLEDPALVPGLDFFPDFLVYVAQDVSDLCVYRAFIVLPVAVVAEEAELDEAVRVDAEQDVVEVAADLQELAFSAPLRLRLWLSSIALCLIIMVIFQSFLHSEVGDL